MRQHREFKLEELLRLSILVLIRLEDFTPDFLDVVLQDGFYTLSVIPAVVEVSENEKQLFGCLLIKELQVDFKYDFKQAII